MASASVTPSQKLQDQSDQVVQSGPDLSTPGASNNSTSTAIAESNTSLTATTIVSTSATDGSKKIRIPNSEPSYEHKTSSTGKPAHVPKPSPTNIKQKSATPAVKKSSNANVPRSTTSPVKTNSGVPVSSSGSTAKPSGKKNASKPKKGTQAVKSALDPISTTSVHPQSSDKVNSASPASPPPTFYSKAKDYWLHTPATIDGMLGGYSSLNVPDIEDSHVFLDEYGPETTAYALDCGCGIGRVTKNLLLPRFNLVDMVELNQSFLDCSEEYIGAQDSVAVGERFCAGLQDFTPPRGRYDLVWIQWVLGHLTDIALVGFLKRCAQALSPGGRIVIKENVTSAESGPTEFDDVDSSFTRSRKAFLCIFQEAGLELFGEKLQTKFPSSMYPVRMFALKPVSSALPVV